MLIHDDKYNTKEVVKALTSLEKAIHTKADWNSYEGFTNQNIVATLDNVLAEGGDY